MCFFSKNSVFFVFSEKVGDPFKGVTIIPRVVQEFSRFFYLLPLILVFLDLLKNGYKGGVFFMSNILLKKKQKWLG